MIAITRVFEISRIQLKLIGTYVGGYCPYNCCQISNKFTVLEVPLMYGSLGLCAAILHVQVSLLQLVRVLIHVCACVCGTTLSAYVCTIDRPCI